MESLPVRGIEEDEGPLIGVDEDGQSPHTLRRFVIAEEGVPGAKSALCFFGIIDILSTYRSKWGPFQQAYKSKILGHDRTALSVVDPETYCRRFVEFLEQHTR